MSSTPQAPPPEAFHQMSAMSPMQLQDLGMQNFNGKLHLFHESWFDHIPEGLSIDYVTGRKGVFERAHTDRDARWGWLAFGIIARG